MENPQELAGLFDEWEKTLEPAQKAWCRRALRNATLLDNIGEISARELIIAVLLFIAGKPGAGTRHAVAPDPGPRPADSPDLM